MGELQKTNDKTNMNKKNIITILLALIAVAGQAQNNNYTIHGNFSEVAEVLSKQGVSFDSITIVNPATIEVVARQNIQNGIFTINGTVEKPFFAQLNIWASSEANGERKRKNSRIPIIIEPGVIEFNGNYPVPVISGTPLNDVLSEAVSMRDNPDYGKILNNLILTHKDDVTAIPLLLMLDDNITDPKILLNTISQFDKGIQHHPLVIRVKEKAETLLTRLDVGDMFMDFTVEYNGKQQHLSDYVGCGKYVLVDFWASWCGPCRNEIPNLIATYNKYKGKDFFVLGVATWDEPEKTLSAIKDLGIPYPQILNAQKKETDIYGIDGIPEIILFAPDGTILARGLRGEEIDKKLTEIFENNQ